MKLIIKLLIITVIAINLPLAFADDTQREYSYVLKNDVRVTIIEEAFDQSKHKVEHCPEKSIMSEVTGQTFICKIDGKKFFGVGESPEPSTELKALIVTIGGRSYKLNTSLMYNAWGDYRLPDKYLRVNCHRHSCFVKGVFSGATGSFDAVWEIKNGKSKRVLISEAESI